MNCHDECGIDKKFSCRKQAERHSCRWKFCYTLLKIYSRSCGMTLLSTYVKFLLAFPCNYVSILYCFWDIQRQIMACPWNLVGVIQGYWICHHSINRIRHKTASYWSAIVSSSILFHFRDDVEEYHDSEIQIRNYYPFKSVHVAEMHRPGLSLCRWSHGSIQWRFWGFHFGGGPLGWRHFHLCGTQLILSCWTTGYVIAYIKL